jgi:hypothetical protein
MESIILGWYVMVHTGSVLLLTVFGSLQFLGTLAAPMFGVLGDRLGSRIMLCAMRASTRASPRSWSWPPPMRSRPGLGVLVAGSTGSSAPTTW